ncbi:MAG: translation initiation factor IF-2 [Chloroflexi bacterium]|nr:translation initiation factor IF-2 [Chloroflexota bacterium]
MRDTSELPDGTEQAKQTSTKPRTSARSRPESTAPGSQDQETKSAPRRRTSPSTHSGTGVRTQNGNEHATASSAPTTAPRPQQSGQRAGGNAPAQRTGGTGSAQHNTGTPTQRYGGNAPSQRTGNGFSQAQRTGGSTAPAPSTGGARPAPAHRPGGNGQQRQGQPYQQRPGTSAGGPSQQGSHSTTARPTNRAGGSGTATARPGAQGHHPGGTHRGGRPGGTTQRTQERRTPVVKEKPTGPVTIPPQIMVKDLAELLHATPNEVIRGLIKHSTFASINQVVDYDKAALVAQDLGFEPSQSAITAAPAVQQGERKLSANEAMMASRNDNNTVVIPPVVTIMGHVDHGKTSLLDVIRKTKVAAGEAGGITQHIGAYQVEVAGKKITFLDTPGHEAFTAMRARGAQVTHIAIIVVAADDGVMPQTREAIDHAQAAKVPIIIALNKIDKANANPDRVKQQLAEIGIVIEEYGGDIVCVPVSARRGTGIDELLEYILLVAEVQDIRADPTRPATGVIIEARLEKNSGPMATVLVQQGTLKMGDNIVVGAISGKVRAMFNDRGKRIQKAPPSTPVSIMGLPEVPQAGDRLEVAPDERTAKQQAQQEAEKRRNETMTFGQVSLDTLYMQMQEGKVKELNIVLKSDVQGTSEAIKNALAKVGDDNMKVRLIHEGIGNISETDVHLAAASGAVIIGFNVKADGASQRQAQKEGVDIRYYDVIYKLIDDIQAALTGMLEPTFREVVDGHAEVLQTFPTKKIVIAGCRVTDGKLARSSQARVMRDGTKVHEGAIASIRRGKDDVREVATGYECGILLEDFNDFEIGDIIEAFSQERVKPGA